VDVAFVLAVIAILAFAFTNGFHDAANAIATLVATRAARPGPAIILAAVCNMLGPLLLGATAAGDAAVKTQRQVERVYRKAASALLTVDDLREVIGRRELYRRFSRVSETLIEAADRVWYATVKEG
jgi:glutamine synthetase adenylyltransferase